ncbi:MAG TPA: hypothetical protein VGQ30_10810 [Gemmatimonadaceae bacterium]|jgi:hypothetical protein|nr:hypothetical protein [Gemmatimonadaceae bacterium]
MPDVPVVELIGTDERPLCYIIRGAPLPDRTNFPTPASLPLQTGFIVYPAGHEIPRHAHLPIKRELSVTSEVLVVLRGRCALDIYDDSRALAATRELDQGDVMVMVGGGHGFRMIEDTVLLEVKQGPYTGLAEKERF